MVQKKNYKPKFSTSLIVKNKIDKDNLKYIYIYIYIYIILGEKWKNEKKKLVRNGKKKEKKHARNGKKMQKQNILEKLQ